MQYNLFQNSSRIEYLLCNKDHDTLIVLHYTSGRALDTVIPRVTGTSISAEKANNMRS